MVHQTSPWNSLLDHLKFPKHLVNSKVGIFFVHNTFHHLFFRYRRYISFLGSCKSYQVSLAFLIASTLGSHSNIVFLGLFYFSILFANCICLPDCWVLHFFSRTVWQIFFSLFYTSMQRLLRTENSFTTLRRCIFTHIPRWRWRWCLWCLRNRLGKFTLVLHFFSFPIFSCSDSVLFKAFFIFLRRNVFFIFSSQVSPFLSLSSLVSPCFYHGTSCSIFYLRHFYLRHFRFTYSSSKKI